MEADGLSEVPAVAGRTGQVGGGEVEADGLSEVPAVVGRTGPVQRPAALRGMTETEAGGSAAIETAVAEAEESRTIEGSAVKTKRYKRYIFVEKSTDCFTTEQ